MNQRYSAEYRQLLKNGPFPGKTDPWAEVGRYFHPLHSQMIGSLMAQNQDTLIEMGYLVGRETSLQVTERREPDIYIERESYQTVPPAQWSYTQAAAEALVEPGLRVEDPAFELDGIRIYNMESNSLVTVIEIISPSNKVDQSSMREYIERRDHLVRGKAVNVVELDLTRSIKRLIQDVAIDTYAYHIAIHLPRERSRFLGVDYGQALKRFALPLQNEVIAVETQAAYDAAYQEGSIAAHIDKEGKYIQSELPFISLLTEEALQESLHAVQQWQETLKQLRSEPA